MSDVNTFIETIGKDVNATVVPKVETLAEMYCRALSIGAPTLLREEEMRAIVDKFAAYNRP